VVYQRATVLCPKKVHLFFLLKFMLVYSTRYLIKGFINHTLQPKGKKEKICKRKNVKKKEMDWWKQRREEGRWSLEMLDLTQTPDFYWSQWREIEYMWVKKEGETIDMTKLLHFSSFSIKWFTYFYERMRSYQQNLLSFRQVVLFFFISKMIQIVK
jgi:hypothetical protein